MSEKCKKVDHKEQPVVADQRRAVHGRMHSLGKCLCFEQSKENRTGVWEGIE